MRDHPIVTQKWEEQIGWFIGFKGHQEFYGIDRESFEFDCNVFPGHNALQLLQYTPTKMATRGIKPEDFRDRIIFMSMYGDIDWSRGEKTSINVFRILRKLGITHTDSRRDIGLFSVR